MSASEGKDDSDYRAKRERFGALVWFLRVSEVAASGLSAHAYCQLQGWSYPTYLRWRQRLCRLLTDAALPPLRRLR